MTYLRFFVPICFVYVIYICLVAVSSCPNGFDFQFLSSCYRIVTLPLLDRRSSQAVCESLSSHLVFIESESERRYFNQTYDRSLQYWLGANGLHNETLSWDDRSSISYNRFGRHNYTFDDMSGCYRIVADAGNGENDVWFDAPCSRNYSYICEYEQGEFLHFRLN